MSTFLVAWNLSKFRKTERWILVFLDILLAWGIYSHQDQKTVTLLAYLQGGSNMTGTDFFFVTIIAKHLLAHVSLQRTPLRSQHIFSNFLEASWCPFQKRHVVGGVSTPEQSGWRCRCPQTACLASLIWAFRTGRNHLGPNRDYTADVSEGSISISGWFPLLFSVWGRALSWRKASRFPPVFRLDRIFSFTSVARRSE